MDGKAPEQFRFGWGNFDYALPGHLLIQYEGRFFRNGTMHCKPDVTSPVIVDCRGNIGLSAAWFKLNYPSCRSSFFPSRTLTWLALSRRILTRLGSPMFHAFKRPLGSRMERSVLTSRGMIEGK